MKKMKNEIIRRIGMFLSIIMIAMCIIGCGNKNTTKTPVMESKTAEDETSTVEETTTEITTTVETTVAKTTTVHSTTIQAATKQPETTKPQVNEQQTTALEVTYSQMTNAQIKEKIAELRSVFPNGKYWNHHNTSADSAYDVYAVTNTPCSNGAEGCAFCNIYKGVTNSVMPYKVKGSQCLGFASLCNDYIFGANENIRVYYDFNQIQIGDQARINNDSHSVLVIDKAADYIVVAECNADYKTCIIGWDRVITKQELAACNSWYISRRPVK